MYSDLKQRELRITEKEKRWEEQKKILQRENNLRHQKMQFFFGKARKKLSTSKLLILLLFINCTIIEIFVGWVTIRSLELASWSMITPDFTPLVTLVGAVVTQVVGYAVYAIKAAKENSKGGITYMAAQYDLQNTYAATPPPQDAPPPAQDEIPQG